MKPGRVNGREIILATGNPAKQELYSQAFARLGWKAVSLRELGLNLRVDENQETPEANALLKAQAIWESGRVVFADDAGMEVDALNGEPGVQTRRWNGKFSNDISDQEWLDYLLNRLSGVADVRSADALA